MDTDLTASVATFRVFSSEKQTNNGRLNSAGPPPRRDERMATTQVTEGPLVLSRLTGNEITYLQVNSFTRAIMPRARIWRVSSNELVIPGSFTNYWLITLTGSPKSIARLDHILKGLCKYEVSSADGEEVTEFTEDELTADESQAALDSPRASGLVASARETISQGRMAERLSGKNEYNSPTYTPQFKRASASSGSASNGFLRESQTDSAFAHDASADDSFAEDTFMLDAGVSRNTRSAPGNLESMLDGVLLATPPVSPPSQPSPSERKLKDEVSLEAPGAREVLGEVDEIVDDLRISVSPPAFEPEVAQSELGNKGTKDVDYAVDNAVDQWSRNQKSNSVPVKEPLQEFQAAQSESLLTDIADYDNTGSEAQDLGPRVERDELPAESLYSAEGVAQTGIEEFAELQLSRNRTHDSSEQASQGLSRDGNAEKGSTESTVMGSPWRGTDVTEFKPEEDDEVLDWLTESRSDDLKIAFDSDKDSNNASVAFQQTAIAAVLKSNQSKFEPRFSHPLIPSSQITWYHQLSAASGSPRPPRLSLQRRELTTLGPSTLHQDVTTVGGYIGLKAVKGILKKT